MNQKKTFRLLSQPKTLLKLPYLQKVDKPKQTLHQSRSNQQPDFNLRTSNFKMPFYNPQSDRNLKIFFEKPSNKKILEKINQKKISKNKKQQKQADFSQAQILLNKHKQKMIRSRHGNLSQNVSRKRIDTISSHQFLSYLQNVRKRILSSAQTNNNVKTKIKSLFS